MKLFGATVALSLAVLSSACLDDPSAGPTPLVNTQLAEYETRVAELEHQLAACYAGGQIEVGEEDKYLPRGQ
jgi:hypothetical protein